MLRFPHCFTPLTFAFGRRTDWPSTPSPFVPRFEKFERSVSHLPHTYAGGKDLIANTLLTLAFGWQIHLPFTTSLSLSLLPCPTTSHHIHLTLLHTWPTPFHTYAGSKDLIANTSLTLAIWVANRSVPTFLSHPPSPCPTSLHVCPRVFHTLPHSDSHPSPHMCRWQGPDR